MDAVAGREQAPRCDHAFGSVPPEHMYLADVVWEVKVYPQVDGLAEKCYSEFKAKVKESAFVPRTRKPRPASLRQTSEELYEAEVRGALTMDELDDELNWLGLGRDEVEPF
jgi:uncharacterized protein YjiS (DUF1127 family)